MTRSIGGVSSICEKASSGTSFVKAMGFLCSLHFPYDSKDGKNPVKVFSRMRKTSFFSTVEYWYLHLIASAGLE